MRALALLLLLACADPNVGSLDHAISDGRAAGPADLGSTVAVRWFETETSAHACSGTLIGSNLVVTAAHCVTTGTPDGLITDVARPADILVVAGALRVDDATEDQLFRGTELHVHPTWPRVGEPVEHPSGAGRADDIAVIELGESPPFAPTPVLPADLVDEVAEGRIVAIEGYGFTAPTFGDEGALYLAETPLFARTSHEIVVGSDDDPGTCSGDSGGPTYLDVLGRRYLIGATSRSRRDMPGDCGGGIMTFVPAYLDWLQETTGTDPSALPAAGTGCSAGGNGALWPMLLLVFARRRDD